MDLNSTLFECVIGASLDTASLTTLAREGITGTARREPKRKPILTRAGSLHHWLSWCGKMGPFHEIEKVKY